MGLEYEAPAGISETKSCCSSCENTNWASYAAAGTLIAAGVLLLSGRRRAGAVTAASGAALALLDQQEAVCKWWNQLPAYIDEVEGFLNKVHSAVEDVSAKRESLRRVLEK